MTITATAADNAKGLDYFKENKVFFFSLFLRFFSFLFFLKTQGPAVPGEQGISFVFEAHDAKRRCALVLFFFFEKRAVFFREDKSCPTDLKPDAKPQI
jgi:hypothetical protein